MLVQLQIQPLVCRMFGAKLVGVDELLQAQNGEAFDTNFGEYVGLPGVPPPPRWSVETNAWI
jgi:hypothetical protein